MELSALEKRLVAQWRKSEAMWPRLRWLAVVVAAVFWSTSTVVSVQLARWGVEAGSAWTGVSFLQDMFFFLNITSLALATFTVFHWRVVRAPNSPSCAGTRK